MITLGCISELTPRVGVRIGGGALAKRPQRLVALRRLATAAPSADRRWRQVGDAPITLRSTFLRLFCLMLMFVLSGGAAPLRVCLVSGANDSAPYSTDKSLGELAGFLEREHGMTCTLLTWDAATAGFRGIERLLEADVAIFFVRRKTPNAHNLDVLRRFFSAGKGFVALRSTSHAWENWTEFDQEVLGAKYGGAKSGNFGDVEKLTYRPHPIWAGGGDFTTRCDIYRYGPVAADVRVILEGENKNGVMPVAWTRVHRGARLVHLALGYAYDLEKPAFRRIVANAVQWVSVSPGGTK